MFQAARDGDLASVLKFIRDDLLSVHAVDENSCYNKAYKQCELVLIIINIAIY